MTAEVAAYSTLLETAAKLAASFERAARENWHLEAELTPDGGAQSPAHIRAAYDQLRAAGLVSLGVDEAYGGFGLPGLIVGMFLQMISRADPSLMMVVGLQTGAADDIQKFGSEEIKRAWLPRFTSGEVQGCMDLTEPQAGSDLGGITTRASELPEGRIQVDGQKIYISNGGAEVHLVLARDADTFEASKGTTNGLSLVLVPRHREDGSRNGVRVARLEHKLGIHGSATCEVIFEGAIGARLGKKGQGFRAMLELMNAARLGVAAQALGLCEAALHDATAYAWQRQQFGAPIAKQPLVKTMLAKMAGEHRSGARRALPHLPAVRPQPGARGGARAPRALGRRARHAAGRPRARHHPGAPAHAALQVLRDRDLRRPHAGRHAGVRRHRLHDGRRRRQAPRGQPDHDDLRGHQRDPGLVRAQGDGQGRARGRVQGAAHGALRAELGSRARARWRSGWKR